MAHAYICQSYDIDTIILYFDDISHQENRALVKKLAIDMVRYTEKLDLTNYQGLAIVDSQLFTVPAPLDELPVISIVDHHKLQPETQADFLDVREDSGSTCSIYAEYLAEVGPALERENSQCGKLASALLYGIRSDTDDYLRAREIDYRAASFLAPYADHELLLSISMQSISPRTMEITQQAYANKVIADTFLIAGAGFVREEDRDSIGQAADYLLQREGIDTVLCYGVINNHFVDGSLGPRVMSWTQTVSSKIYSEQTHRAVSTTAVAARTKVHSGSTSAFFAIVATASCSGNPAHHRRSLL